MKRILTLILAGWVLTSAAWAHCGNCPGDKAKPDAAAPAKCEKKPADECPMAAALGKLNLTDEQKAKIAELKQSCAKATSQSEARQQCSAGLQKILTAEQYQQWQDACKAGEKKCGEGCTKPCCKK